MLLEGKKGRPSTPVMPFYLNVRPVIDEKYIIPKTIDFIKREAAAGKPFLVYVGYSEMHPPAIANSQFARTSTARGGLYSDIIGEMDFRIGQVLDAIDAAGVTDNTILIVSSDNATDGIDHPKGGSNGP